MNKKCILVLGGARSGKSSFAQKLASELSNTILFVATGTAGDEEMRQRIELHRQSRPASWRTLEVQNKLGEVLKKETGDAQVVLIDCLSFLVYNLLPENDNESDIDSIETKVRSELTTLIDTINDQCSSFIIVSNEVGLGVVPPYPLGRLYRDVLGRANQIMAERADEVYLMTAGIPLKLK